MFGTIQKAKIIIKKIKRGVEVSKDKECCFGIALKMMKNGYHMSRKSWIKKDMFAYYQKGYPDGISCNKQTAIAVGLNEGDLFKCRPYLQLKCTDGSYEMWNPSVSDILAEDWTIFN